MSGMSSRQRRKQAVNLARDDCYRNKGEMYKSNPFDDERRARIYSKYYEQFMRQYGFYDTLAKDMAQAYGYNLLEDGTYERRS